MRSPFLPALSCLLMLAAACATPPPAERAAFCRTNDWTSYGRNDGELGVPPAYRAEQFADCATLGWPADLAAYDAGQAEGLAEYCTAANGYQVGYAGQPYRNACPPDLAQAFLQGYALGRRERPIEDDVLLGFLLSFATVDYDDFERHRHRDRRGHRGRGDRTDQDDSDDRAEWSQSDDGRHDRELDDRDSSDSVSDRDRGATPYVGQCEHKGSER